MAFTNFILKKESSFLQWSVPISCVSYLGDKWNILLLLLLSRSCFQHYILLSPLISPDRTNTGIIIILSLSQSPISFKYSSLLYTYFTFSAQFSEKFIIFELFSLIWNDSGHFGLYGVQVLTRPSQNYNCEKGVLAFTTNIHS